MPGLFRRPPQPRQRLPRYHHGYREVVTATAGLISYWRLGDTSGTTAADSFDANPGTYAGSPSLGTTAGAIFNDPDTAVTFDGTDDTVVVPGHASLRPSTAVTLEAWVKYTSPPQANRDVIRHSASAVGWWLRRVDFADDIEFRVYAGGASTTEYSGAAAGDGAWHHIVGTYDGSNIRVYRDGALVAGPTARTGTIDYDVADLGIGVAGNGASELFVGDIDEVALYSVALDAATILAHYNAGVDLGPELVIRTATDSLTFSDTATRVGTFVRSVSDSLTHSDAATRVGTFLRTVTDSLTFSDVASATKVLIRSAADALTFSDAAIRVGTFLRSPTDSLTSSDTATRVTTALRSAVDSLTTSDTATRTGTFLRTVADSLTFSDVAAAVKLIIRSAVDSLTTSDVATRVVTAARSAADALTFSDTATRIATVVRSAADSLTTSDVATRVATLIRNAVDALTFSDIASRIISALTSGGLPPRIAAALNWRPFGIARGGGTNVASPSSFQSDAFQGDSVQ